MDRDLIVVLSNCDCTYVNINGKGIGSFERVYEIIDVLPKIFAHLEHSYNKPLIYEVYQDDYFTIEEMDLFWSREFDENFMFSQDELDILVKTGDVDLFVDKIKQNLERRRKDV